MSRTYRHTKKNSKHISGIIVDYYFSYTFLDERKMPKEKGGYILKGNEDTLIKYRNGSYSFGIERDFRKAFNKKQKTKFNRSLKNALKYDDFDSLGKERFIKNAGLYYY